MDPDIVKAKLESLARCIRRIEAKMPPSVVDLEEDLDCPSPDSMAGVFIRLGKEKIIGQALAWELTPLPFTPVPRC